MTEDTRPQALGDSNSRMHARALAEQALAQGKPLAWFERLYAKARMGEAEVPWDHCEPNPHVVELLDKFNVRGDGRRALVVGCGLGDDAEFLSKLGFEVTAFDIAPTAIEMAKARFQDSSVAYRVEDVLNMPEGFQCAFDLIWESYTVQAMPESLRAQALAVLPALLAQGGELFIATHARDEDEPLGEVPWPLKKSELDVLSNAGLQCLYFEDYLDAGEPPVRRFRAVYKKRK